MSATIRIVLAAAVFSALASGRAQDKPQDQNEMPHVFRQKVTKTLSYQYLLFLPRDYSADKKKDWPLLLFLHGVGERGANVWRADLHGPAKYASQHPDFPFVMVTPLCPSNEIWSVESLSALLDYVVKKYRVDTNRVYLTGLSMGGFGAWDLALAEPQRFAAVIPIAGGGNDMPIIGVKVGAAPEYGRVLRTVAFWAFHGAKDNVVAPDESERMIAGLKKIGVPEAKITIYPDAMHNSWERTYDNPEIYAWLLQHHR